MDVEAAKILAEAIVTAAEWFAYGLWGLGLGILFSKL